MKNLNDPDQFGPVQRARMAKNRLDHAIPEGGTSEHRNIMRFDPAADSWHK
jgi:hypothetical protein